MGSDAAISTWSVISSQFLHKGRGFAAEQIFYYRRKQEISIYKAHVLGVSPLTIESALGYGTQFWSPALIS